METDNVIILPPLYKHEGREKTNTSKVTQNNMKTSLLSSCPFGFKGDTKAMQGSVMGLWAWSSARDADILPGLHFLLSFSV